MLEWSCHINQWRVLSHFLRWALSCSSVMLLLCSWRMWSLAFSCWGVMLSYSSSLHNLRRFLWHSALWAQRSLRGYFLAEILQTFFSVFSSEVSTTFVYSLSSTGVPRLNSPEAILYFISALMCWLLSWDRHRHYSTNIFFQSLCHPTFSKKWKLKLVVILYCYLFVFSLITKEFIFLRTAIAVPSCGFILKFYHLFWNE